MSAAASLPALVPGINDVAGLCAAIRLIYEESEAAEDDSAVEAAVEVEGRITAALAALPCRNTAEAAEKAALLAWYLIETGGPGHIPAEVAALLASLARDLRALAADLPATR